MVEQWRGSADATKTQGGTRDGAAGSKKYFLFLGWIWILAAVGVGPSGHAAPIRNTQGGSAIQSLGLQVKKIRQTASVLPGNLQVEILGREMAWTYLPDSRVSLPFLAFELKGIPPGQGTTVLIEKMGKIAPDKSGRYVLKVPLMSLENPFKLSLIGTRGNVEEWSVLLSFRSQESMIYVDENCTDFKVKFKEMRRSERPNLIYVGCRSGSSPHHLSVDLFWNDITHLTFKDKTVPSQNSFVTVPIAHNEKNTTVLKGAHRGGETSILTVEYDPVVPLPYEIWAGLAFFRTAFGQSNFSSLFSQYATAFMGKFWYRPEDTDFSAMIRGFGSVIAFSNKLDPDNGTEESVRTYFTSVEGRYKLLDRSLWRISPFLGGWLFFMNVKSRQFGLQRIITPVVGVSVEKAFNRWDRLDGVIRIVPLQSFFNPFAFSLKEIYFEAELTFVHEFQRRGRIFGTAQLSLLRFNPDGMPDTRGSYIIAGLGYGF